LSAKAVINGCPGQLKITNNKYKKNNNNNNNINNPNFAVTICRERQTNTHQQPKKGAIGLEKEGVIAISTSLGRFEEATEFHNKPINSQRTGR